MGVNPYVYSNAIKGFVLENGLRGTQSILLWRGVKPVGYGKVVMTDGTQSPMTTTTNTTATALRAFPDPLDKRWDSAGLTVEFYGYRGSIPPLAMAGCIAAACDDFRNHVSVITRPMTETDGLSVLLHPGRRVLGPAPYLGPLPVHIEVPAPPYPDFSHGKKSSKGRS